ncbi:hypothetical protein ACFQ8T_04470 [Isoptericola sp. NPDC056618]|uniref:hypothetical protein n=1 Tax=Isoptericola sp. NPDC056618 TaxID=3345878 RepID=UPI0036BECD67
MAYLSKYVFIRACRGGVVRVPPEGVRCSAKGLAGMRQWGRAGTPTTAVLLLAVLVACTPSTEASPTPTPTTTSSTSTPTSDPSPSPTTDSEVAAQNATELLHQYYAVIDALGAEPDEPLSRLESVAISKDLSVWEQQLKRDRRDGYRQTGETKLVEVAVGSVNLDNSDPDAGTVPTIQLDVCYDVSGVDVVDADGKSIVADDRADTGWVRHTVSNYSWDTDPDDGWRVSTSVDLEQAPCDTES